MDEIIIAAIGVALGCCFTAAIAGFSFKKEAHIGMMEARNLVSACETSLPRDQICRLIAEPVVPQPEVKVDETR